MMWFLVWVALATGVPLAPAAIFRAESLCNQTAAALNLDKPDWGEYRCERGVET